MNVRVRCTILLVVLSAAILAPVTSVAASGVYPPTTPAPNGLAVTTDHPTYFPGATVVITATNCVSGTSVTFTITPAAGGAAITLSGTCASPAVVTIPAGAIGQYTVVATNAGNTASTTFQVVALPTTGASNLSETLIIGSLAIGVGVAMILVSRTRRRHATA